MHLDTQWTLRATGWLALAVGLAARAGVPNRPPRLLVAAAAGVVLYAEAGWLINTAAMYNPVDYVMPALIYEAITGCLVSFALMAIIWTAFTRLRSGGEPVWVLVLAAVWGLCGLELYYALNMNIDFTYWLLPWVDPDTLANALLGLQSLSFGLLIAALLIGLRPPIPVLPGRAEGAPQPDSESRPEIATP